MLAREIVDDTGLVYLFARYYDPEIGRFYALDPELGSLSMPQTLSRYVYCVNSPLIYTDPTGRAINFLAGAIGAVVGAALSGVITYALTGDVDATIAAAAGGAVAGALTGLTMGSNLLVGTALTGVGRGMIIGAGTGAAGGAVEGGVGAAIGSNGDIGAIAKGAIFGAATGAATGMISGGLSNKLIPTLKIIPKDEVPYSFLLKKSQTSLTNLKASSYATKEGIVEGGALLSERTANNLGKAATVSFLISYGKAFGTPIGIGVKTFNEHYSNEVMNALRHHSGA